MQLVVVLTEDQHYQALQFARQINLRMAVSAGKANAPLLAEATRWLSDVWDTVEEALDKARQRGLDASRALMTEVSRKVDEMVALGAAWLDDVLTVVRERLSEYLRRAIQDALRIVQKSIMIGDRELKLARVTVTNSIKVSASVKASLLEVCEFVGEGQMELAAEYSSD